MMTLCQPCRDLVRRHPKAARRVAFIIFLSLFFTVLGWISDPVYAPGLCKIYP
jgi:hypothetical protein